MQFEVSSLDYQDSRTSLCHDIIFNDYTTDFYYIINLKHDNISDFQHIQNRSSKMIKLLL